MSLSPERGFSALLYDDEWLAMWNLAVTTQRSDEEAWAFLKLKAAYGRVMGDLPIDPQRQLPAGMWEAMAETGRLVTCQPTS